jgi:hypothetical protein
MQHYEQLKKEYLAAVTKAARLEAIQSRLRQGYALRIFAIQGSCSTDTLDIRDPYLEEFVDLIESTREELQDKAQLLETKLLAVEELLKG